MAGAQEPLTNLRVEGVDQAGQAGEGVFKFPDGTKKVMIKVDHNLAGSETLGVSVVALSVPSFSSQKSVSGKGTASFDLTGEAVYSGMAAGASRAADSAAQSVALAVKGTGMQDYLLSAKANVNSVLGTVAVLKGLSLDAAYAGQVKTLDEAATSALDRINAALDVPATNSDEKKAKAVDAQASLPALQQAAKAVSERLASATGLSLPKTGDDSKIPYNINVTRDGQTAMSTEMLVGTGSLVPDPTATSPSRGRRLRRRRQPGHGHRSQRLGCKRGYWQQWRPGVVRRQLQRRFGERRRRYGVRRQQRHPPRLGLAGPGHARNELGCPGCDPGPTWGRGGCRYVERGGQRGSGRPAGGYLDRGGRRGGCRGPAAARHR